jgi:hypothetical protein
MSIAKTKSEYMLLFRGNDWHKGLSAEEIERVSNEWMGWFKGLGAEGKVIAGSPLEAEVRVVSGKNGSVVADGPFAESKEAIGGYFLLRVDTFEEAVAVAKQCPGLPYGARIEVRQVAEQCPLLKESAREPELAQVGA